MLSPVFRWGVAKQICVVRDLVRKRRGFVIPQGRDNDTRLFHGGQGQHQQVAFLVVILVVFFCVVGGKLDEQP